MTFIDKVSHYYIKLFHNITENSIKQWTVMITSIAAIGFLYISNIERKRLQNSKKSQNHSKLSKELKKWLELWCKSDCFPSLALTILKDNEKIFNHRVGYSHVLNRQEIHDETIYRIYSMTKPIISMAILILVDKKLISLDDNVSKYISSFQSMKVLNQDNPGTLDHPNVVDMTTSMTIRHLLTHTSGILIIDSYISPYTHIWPGLK